MPNLSQIKRQRMLDFLETLKKEHTDDESIRAFTEIENQLRDKKYGLVWEEHSERVDEMLAENIPIFIEDTSKKITASEDGGYNFILEGDNLQSLYLLQKTHKRLIDVIYIDPPYNTGNEDFFYNDNMVGTEDTFRHSKWLSFMDRRLRIAYDLLSPHGVIFISIDDNEMAPLKLLCDEIFNPKNFVAQLVWEKKKKGSFLSNQITNIKEYVLVYCKDKDSFSGLIGEINTDTETYPCINASNRRSVCKVSKGIKSNYREKNFVVSAGTVISDSTMNIKYLSDLVIEDGIVTQDFEVEGNWRYKGDAMYEYSLNGELYITNALYIRRIVSMPRYKTMKDLLSRVGNDENTTYSTPININNLFDSGWGSNEDADNELIDFFGAERIFSYPKPVRLIKKLICSTRMTNAVILDFFAGSGTTSQAVMELNAEDSGQRKFIICTNNEVTDKKKLTYFIEKDYIEAPPRKGTKKEPEWKAKWVAFKSTDEYQAEVESAEYQSLGICHSVTYPRVSTVITGIRKDGTNYSDGIPANLKYFKCDWTPRKPEDYLLSNALCLHIREMIELQHGIEVDNIKNVLILNKEDFRKYVTDNQNNSQIENIWVNQNIIFNSEEMERLNALGFKYIPREFFGQELREAAE